MKDKDVSMRELFRIITETGLTPNQFYVMCGMKESISPSKEINIHSELRVLQQDEWVTADNKLTAKADELIIRVDSLFSAQKKKTVKQLLGTGYAEMIEKYSSYWDMGKLPSGKQARAAKGNVESAFKWFFENYDYSWELIFQATVAYINDYESKTPKYIYMRTSQYFIRKQASDKSWNSELADYCENIKRGTTESKSNHFSEKLL